MRVADDFGPEESTTPGVVNDGGPGYNGFVVNLGVTADFGPNESSTPGVDKGFRLEVNDFFVVNLGVTADFGPKDLPTVEVANGLRPRFDVRPMDFGVASSSLDESSYREDTLDLPLGWVLFGTDANADPF